MGEFSAEGSFLDKDELTHMYCSLFSLMMFRAIKIKSIINSLNNYSGLGIETQITNLQKCCDRLVEHKNIIQEEYFCYERIADAISSCERRAKEIIGGDGTRIPKIVLVKPESLTKTFSHSDLGKLTDQLKYYTQNYADVKKIYDRLMKAYDSGKDYKMTDSEYGQYKDVLTGIFARSYTYSTVEYFVPKIESEEKGVMQSTDIGISVKKSSDDKYSSKVKLDVTALSGENSLDVSAMKITTACKNGDDYLTDVLTLSNVKLSEEADLLSFDIGELFKRSKNIDSISDLFEPFGIEFSGSTSAIQGIETYTHKVNDSFSYYNKNVYTIGELTAEFNMSSSEAKAKLGYSVASVKSSHGIKTNDGTYSVGGKMSAGEEFGFEFGKENEVNAGMFGLGVDFGDGFDYYVWQ